MELPSLFVVLILVYAAYKWVEMNRERDEGHAYIIWAHGTAFEKALAKDGTFDLDTIMAFNEEARVELMTQAYPDFIPEVIEMYTEMDHIRLDPEFKPERHITEYQYYRATRRAMRGANFLGGLKSRVYNL